MKLRTNQTICCLGFPMGGKFPTTIFLGSRVENSKFKILCKRIAEELRISNVFKKTIEARWATSKHKISGQNFKTVTFLFVR